MKPKGFRVLVWTSRVYFSRMNTPLIRQAGIIRTCIAVVAIYRLPAADAELTGIIHSAKTDVITRDVADR
jgi:hypothetical protein